jgi:hypothetical protein
VGRLRELRPEGGAGSLLEISTVDGFQGREKASGYWPEWGSLRQTAASLAHPGRAELVHPYIAADAGKGVQRAS